MVTCAIGLKLVCIVVYNITTEFLMKALRVLLILYSSRHSGIHVHGVEFSTLVFLPISICAFLEPYACSS